MNKNIIFENEDCVTKYFKEVKDNPLISADEEYDLAVRAKNGDKVAADKLVLANLRFVVKIAKQYQGNGMSLSDLINEGNIGLIKAVHKFEPDRRFKFISYAVWWVRQSIRQSLSENSRIVKVPTSLTAKSSAIKNDVYNYEAEYGIHPIFGDIINDNGDTYDYHSEAYRVYLNDAISDDSGSYEMIDMLESDTIIEPFGSETETLVNSELMRVLSLLDDRERDIIKCYFGFESDTNMTLETIGEKYDLTKERIRQIKENSILKLRHNSANLLNLIEN
jgi:RNA polymerase primary sigma factor